MTNRKRAKDLFDKISGSDILLPSSYVTLFEIALNQAFDRGRKQGIEEAAKLSDRQVFELKKRNARTQRWPVGETIGGLIRELADEGK